MSDENENNEYSSIDNTFPIDYFNEGVDIDLMDTIDLTDVIDTIDGDLNE